MMHLTGVGLFSAAPGLAHLADCPAQGWIDLPLQHCVGIDQPRLDHQNAVVQKGLDGFCRRSVTRQDRHQIAQAGRAGFVDQREHGDLAINVDQGVADQPGKRGPVFGRAGDIVGSRLADGRVPAQNGFSHWDAPVHSSECPWLGWQRVSARCQPPMVLNEPAPHVGAAASGSARDWVDIAMVSSKRFRSQQQCSVFVHMVNFLILAGRNEVPGG
jgi:hypothetical protein